MTNELTTALKRRMRRLDRRTHADACESLCVAGSRGIVGLEGGANEKIGQRTMLYGSLTFQRTLRTSGPRLGGRCFLRQSYSSRGTEIKSRGEGP